MDNLSYSEQKRILKTLLELEEARRLNPIDSYEPHEGQVPFHRSEKRVRLLCGGNRSGKSTAGITEDIWWSTGTHPYKEIEIPNKGWICGTDFPHGVGSVLVPKFKEMYPKNEIARIVKNQQGIETYFEFKNGSVVEFKSYDQAVGKFESADVDWVHFDEPPPKDVFEGATRGLIDRRGSCWLTLTPISEAWLYKELWINPSKDVDKFRISTYDNPYISREGIETFAAGLSDDHKRARLYGEFLQLQGRVFKCFEKKTHVIEGFQPQRGWPVFMGVDPHVYGRKNQAALWMCMTPDNDMIFFDEIWEDLTIEQLRNKIIEHDFMHGAPRYNMKARVVDTSINVREAISHKNFKQILEAPGLWGIDLKFRMANKRNLLNPGLEHINSLLTPKMDRDGTARPKIYVDGRCRRLIEEFELHGWKSKRNESSSGVEETELNTYNDMLSIARYIFNINPMNIKNHKFLKFNTDIETYGGSYAY